MIIEKWEEGNIVFVILGPHLIYAKILRKIGDFVNIKIYKINNKFEIIGDGLTKNDIISIPINFITRQATKEERRIVLVEAL